MSVPRLLHWLCCLALICQGATSPIHGTEQQPTAQLRVTVERLIKQLDSPRRQERVIAEQELRKLGPKILPVLPALDLVPGRTGRAVLTQLRAELEQQLATRELSASRVTISGTLPLNDALLRIAGQTGNHIVASELPANIGDQPLEIHFKETPFWSAILDLANRSQLEFNVLKLRSGEPAVHVTPRKAESAAWVADASGVALFELTECSVRPFFGDAESRLLRCRLRVLVEPRLQPLFLKYGSNSWQLSPTKKITVEPLFPSESSVELPFGRKSNASRWQIDFKSPAAITDAMLRLQGRVQLQVAARLQEFRFRQLRSNTRDQIARRHAGLTVTLNRVQSRNERQFVSVSIAYDTGGPAFESHRTWILHNTAYLEDQQGLRFPVESYELTRQASGGIAVTYRFNSANVPLSDLQFVYVAPTLVRAVSLEFELPQFTPRR